MTNAKILNSVKVIKISRPEPVISPPEGWQLKSPYGFNRAKNAEGKNIDLARLGDVLDWLETTQELPSKAALELLLEQLEKGISQGVYYLHQGKYAGRLPDDWSWWHFGCGPLNDRASSPSVSKLLLRHFLEGYWTNPVNDDVNRNTTEIEDWPINKLAIPIAAAHAAWGYGRIEAPAVHAGVIQEPSLTAHDVTDWKALVGYRKNTRSSARWNDAHRRILKAELTRRVTDNRKKSESQIKEEMASELGLKSRQAIDFQLKQLGTTSKRDKNQANKYGQALQGHIAQVKRK